MRTALIIATAGAITLAGFALAQGPRAPAEAGARAPQTQEQQAHRQERRALHQQQNLEQNLERAESIATMTRQQTMLRKAECDDPTNATAEMKRLQRGPQARW